MHKENNPKKYIAAILMLLYKMKRIVLDTLFPVQCLFCKADDVWICKSCLEKIKIISVQVCPYCEKNITPGGATCSFCREKFFGKNQKIPLDNLIIASKYKENSISRLIHLFKYRFISDLSVPLGKIMIKTIIKNNLPLPDLIIPIPLHKRRLRWRGFNQSELLADYISKNLTPGFSIPVFADLIIRKKYTTPQMKIKKYKARQENIKNMFAINSNPLLPQAGEGARRADEGIKNRTILLVDDIATTGSTLFECAKVLKSNSASKVYACVTARQEWKNVL